MLRITKARYNKAVAERDAAMARVAELEGSVVAPATDNDECDCEAVMALNDKLIEGFKNYGTKKALYMLDEILGE